GEFRTSHRSGGRRRRARRGRGRRQRRSRCRDPRAGSGGWSPLPQKRAQSPSSGRRRRSPGLSKSCLGSCFGSLEYCLPAGAKPPAPSKVPENFPPLPMPAAGGGSVHAIGRNGVLEEAREDRLALDDALAVAREIAVAADGDGARALDAKGGEAIVDAEQQQVVDDGAGRLAEVVAGVVAAGEEADGGAFGIIEAGAGQRATRMLAEIDVVAGDPAAGAAGVHLAPAIGAAVDLDAGLVTELAGDVV